MVSVTKYVTIDGNYIITISQADNGMYTATKQNKNDRINISVMTAKTLNEINYWLQ